tara:strand:+ start:555 stop:809 length:255 start_codon:yes stop_codon:yes gene_type:complete
MKRGRTTMKRNVITAVSKEAVYHLYVFLGWFDATRCQALKKYRSSALLIPRHGLTFPNVRTHVLRDNVLFNPVFPIHLSVMEKA